MRRWILLSFLCLSFVFLSTSCQTKVVTEYVPMEMDLTDVINPVLEQRPDNSSIIINEKPDTLLAVMENSASYMYAWEMWQAYADSLEQTLTIVQEKLKGGV